MKKILLLFILTAAIQTSAQNGFTSYGSPSGYTGAQLSYKNALVIDNNNNKWIAYAKIGLGKFDGSNWTMFTRLNSSLPSDTVKALAVDASNNLWIGTYNGLAKFNGTTWTIYNTSNSPIPDNNIVSLAIDGNNIWIGTNFGAAKYNGSSWIIYNTSNSGIANDTVQSFSFDQSGNIFIGTKNGLSKLNSSTWTIFNSGNSGLLSDNILSLFFYQGNLWIGTYAGGLHKYYSNVITDIQSFYGNCSTEGITTGKIYSITQGPSGGIISSYNPGFGLLEVLPFIGKMKPYSKWPNPVSTKCFLAHSNSDGLLYFANSTWNNINLYSFDVNGYNGLEYGYYTDYMNCIDINDVEAMIRNQGNLFLNNAGSAQYEVPKGSGLNTMFASSLWIGGIDNGSQLHLAAQTFGQTGTDFWPGPLDTVNGECDSTTAYLFDRIWKINRYKVEEFKYYFANGSVQNGTYIPDYDIISWPAHGNVSKGYSKNLAPFADVNGDGNYNPMSDGDYPLIRGDQELFCIFNDNLVPPGTHTETGGLPLKIEVHLSAYAYTCPSVVDSLKELNYSTFYHYEIFNRSTNKYDKVHMGSWQDVDLGCYTDDYVGCLKDKNFGFVHNDSIDDPNCASPGYGNSPPIFSTAILDGPLANANDGIDNNNNGSIDEFGEKNLMTSFLYYDNANGVPWGNPSNAQHFYNYLKGIWGDGSPQIDCHNDTTTFSYEGQPYNPNSCAITNFPAIPQDRRMLLGCGPYTLMPGAKAKFDYGIVFSRDTNIAWGTVPYYQQAEKDVATIQNWYAAGNFPSCLLLNVAVNENPTPINALSVYPNPASDFLNINYASKNLRVQFEIIDLTGKTVLLSKEQQINISKLPQGLYLLKVRDGELSFSKRFIKN